MKTGRINNTTEPKLRSVKAYHMQIRTNQCKQRLTLMAKLFVAIFLITVLEGAFRKWVNQGLTYPLVALRDGLAFFGVAYAIKMNHVRLSPNIFRLLFTYTSCVIAWALLQATLLEYPTVVLLFGLRFWLLYLWFAVLSGISMTNYDFRFICKMCVALLALMTPLAVVQHFMPVESIWNKQVDENFQVFVVTKDIVRTTGTFSFTTGYSTFLSVAAPVVLLGLSSRNFWKKRTYLILSITSLAIATVVSGSRGAILIVGGLLITYSISNVIIRRGKNKLVAVSTLILSFIVLSVVINVFSRAVDATTTRFETAAKNENFFDRLAYTFIPRGEPSFLGEGIGMGSNVASAVTSGKQGAGLAESENARVILEAGAMGFIVLILKIAVASFGILKSLTLAHKRGNIISLNLWLISGIALLGWPLSGQLTVNTLGYLLIGLAIASIRLETAKKL